MYNPPKIGPTSVEEGENVELAADDGPVQHRVLLVVHTVHVSAPVHKELYDFDVAGYDRQVQRGVALVVLLVKDATKCYNYWFWAELYVAVISRNNFSTIISCQI